MTDKKRERAQDNSPEPQTDAEPGEGERERGRAPPGFYLGETDANGRNRVRQFGTEKLTQADAPQSAGPGNREIETTEN